MDPIQEDHLPKDVPAPLPLAVRPAEAARLLGISRAAVYRQLGAGELTAVKFGAATLVTTESIRQFLAGLPRFRTTLQQTADAA